MGQPETIEKKASLYDLTADLIEIEAALAENPESADELIKAWTQANASLTDKVDAYCGLIRSKLAAAKMFEAEKKVLDEEAAFWGDKAKAATAVANRLKEGLRWHFDATGTDRIEGRMFKAALEGNGGLAPLLVTCDPRELPPDCQTVEPNNVALRAKLEAGEVVEGAMLGKRGQHVAIR